MTDPHSKISVQVHYIAATKPFKGEYDPETKLSVVKADALNFFELREEQTKVYKLFYQKTELTNLDETIGTVAGGKHEVVLDLEEFIIQGMNG
jgi:hypothetical protein